MFRLTVKIGKEKHVMLFDCKEKRLDFAANMLYNSYSVVFN